MPPAQAYVKLISLDLSTFNTSFVTDMGYLFAECFQLSYLDITHFRTSKVRNMDFMFSECHSLKSLN